MDRRHTAATTRDGTKVLFWLGFLAFIAFLGYSFHSTMDLREMATPHRQESLARVLRALSRPRILDLETNLRVAALLWQTIQIAFLATTLSAVFAVSLTLLSARSTSGWGRALRTLLYPVLAAIRAVHPLILAIPAIVIAGIGPMAGVLALTLFTTAVLTREFSEYAQDHASLAWPVLLKVYFPALALKHLHVSMLIASVLGFFGGGGIGFIIQMQLNLLDYRGASVGILACIVVIGAADLAGHAVWRRARNHGLTLTPTSETSELA